MKVIKKEILEEPQPSEELGYQTYTVKEEVLDEDSTVDDGGQEILTEPKSTEQPETCLVKEEGLADGCWTEDSDLGQAILTEPKSIEQPETYLGTEEELEDGWTANDITLKVSVEPQLSEKYETSFVKEENLDKGWAEDHKPKEMCEQSQMGGVHKAHQTDCLKEDESIGDSSEDNGATEVCQEAQSEGAVRRRLKDEDDWAEDDNAKEMNTHPLEDAGYQIYYIKQETVDNDCAEDDKSNLERMQQSSRKQGGSMQNSTQITRSTLQMQGDTDRHLIGYFPSHPEIGTQSELSGRETVMGRNTSLNINQSSVKSTLQISSVGLDHLGHFTDIHVGTQSDSSGRESSTSEYCFRYITNHATNDQECGITEQETPDSGSSYDKHGSWKESGSLGLEQDIDIGNQGPSSSAGPRRKSTEPEYPHHLHSYDTELNSESSELLKSALTGGDSLSPFPEVDLKKVKKEFAALSDDELETDREGCMGERLEYTHWLKSFVGQKNLEAHDIKHCGKEMHKCSACRKAYLPSAKGTSTSEDQPEEPVNQQYLMNSEGSNFTHNKSNESDEMSEGDAQKEKEKHTCHICSKPFNSFYSIFHHVRREHPMESLSSYNQDLVKRRSVCKKCGFAFRRKDTLERHELIHKRGDLYPRQRPQNKPVMKPTRPGKITCKICDRVFLGAANLAAHTCMEEAHPEECDESIKRKKKYCCDMCGQLLISQKNLDRHILVHQEPKFTCPICNKKLKHAETLKTHMRTHTSEKPYNCDICKQSFTQHSTYVQHICIRSSGDRPLECDICSKKFIRRTELKLHQAKHTFKLEDSGSLGLEQDIDIHVGNQGPSSSAGPRRKSTEPEYPDHLHRYDTELNSESSELLKRALTGGDSLPPFPEVDLKKVKKEFAALSDDELETDREGCTGELLECTHWLKSFVGQKNLEAHDIKHCGKEMHKCSACRKAYLPSAKGTSTSEDQPEEPVNQQYLMNSEGSNFTHNKSNESDEMSEGDAQKEKEKHTCHICSKPFNSFYSIFHHMRREHPMESLPSYNQDFVKRRFVCKKCGFAFRRKDALERHELIHKRGDLYPRQRPSNKPVMKPRPGKIICKICDGVFFRAANLEAHMEEAHPEECDESIKGKKKYCCELCGKLLMSQRSLDRHIVVHQEPKFTCSICDKKLKHAETLKIHMRTHTGEKPYNCDICKQSFTQHSSYVKHMCIHSGDRPHKCDICSKKFIRRTELKLHQAKHTNNREFPCNYCSKMFKSERIRKVHETQLHSSNAQLYMCEKCGKSFNWSSGLKAHACSHLGDAPFKCQECNKGFSQALFLKRHMNIHTKPMSHTHQGRPMPLSNHSPMQMRMSHAMSSIPNPIQPSNSNQIPVSLPNQVMSSAPHRASLSVPNQAPMSLPHQGPVSLPGQVQAPLTVGPGLGQSHHHFLPNPMMQDRNMFGEQQYQVQDSTNQAFAAMLTQMSTL